MSLIKIPEAVGLQFTLLLKNMLSIGVQLFSEKRVGNVIAGKNELDNILSKKSPKAILSLTSTSRC